MISRLLDPGCVETNKIWRGLNVEWGGVTLLFIDAGPARRAIHEAVNAKQLDPHTVPDGEALIGSH